MANTYILIASNTVSGSTTTQVVFSNIPQTYTDLVVRFSARTDRTGFIFDDIKFTMPSASSNSWQLIEGQGTAVSVTTNAANSWIQSAADTASATGNVFSNVEAYLSDYTATGQRNTNIQVAHENNTSSARRSHIAHLSNASATSVTEITFSPNNGTNFIAGSSFYLYGIKNS